VISGTANTASAAAEGNAEAPENPLGDGEEGGGEAL